MDGAIFSRCATERNRRDTSTPSRSRLSAAILKFARNGHGAIANNPRGTTPLQRRSTLLCDERMNGCSNAIIWFAHDSTMAGVQTWLAVRPHENGFESSRYHSQ